MNKIYEILQNIRPEFNFRESRDFIEDGFLDSFDVVTLVSDLDNEFNISIDGLDIIPENFTSAEAIANIIKSSGGKI